MKTQLTKRSLIALALIAMLAGSAGAAVLHDQSSYGAWTNGFLNAEAGGPPMGATSYSMSDIEVTGTGWRIESISIIVEAIFYENVNTAYVNIFPKTGPLPTDIPTTNHPVDVTVTLISGETFMITASGLAIDLEPGDFWVGLTPAAGNLFDGVHIPSDTFVGAATPSYGWPTPEWTTPFPDTDATILIEGDNNVVSTESVSMGSVKALFR